MLAVAVGVAAAAIGIAGYHKASTLQEEIRRPKAPVADHPGDDDLEEAVHRLESRVARLESRDRSTARDPEPADAGPSPDDGAPASKDPHRREEHKRKVSAAVEAYWKVWGAKHGLTPTQSDALAAMQVDAAKRRLDNRARLTEREITHEQVRTEGQVITEEVRRKARALLTPEQFAEFEAEKGAETGSSYRTVRERHGRADGAPP